MALREAMFFICDDVLIALNGKLAIAGLYTADIVIPEGSAQVGQLVFMFEIKTPIETPFKSLILQVSFPGEKDPRQLDVTQALRATPLIPGRTTITYRLPFLIQLPTLNSGPIEAKIIHEEGVLVAGKQWIVTAEEMQANLIAAAGAATNV